MALLSRRIFLAAAILTVGCANTDLQRFAPPGIFKYQEIAAEKDPNPTIVEFVETRDQIVDEKFPVLSETPTAGRKLHKPDRSIADREAETITDARDALENAISEDREESQRERDAVRELENRTDEFLETLEQDAASARRERKTPLEIPDEK